MSIREPNEQDIILDIRRIQRKYRSKLDRVDFSTRFDHIIPIPMTSRQTCCYESFKYSQRTQKNFIISRFKYTDDKFTSIVGLKDYLSSCHSAEIDMTLPKLDVLSLGNYCAVNIDSIQLKQIRDLKTQRRLLILEKAQKVMFSCLYFLRPIIPFLDSG